MTSELVSRKIRIQTLALHLPSTCCHAAVSGTPTRRRQAHAYSCLESLTELWTGIKPEARVSDRQLSLHTTSAANDGMQTWHHMRESSSTSQLLYHTKRRRCNQKKTCASIMKCDACRPSFPPYRSHRSCS